MDIVSDIIQYFHVSNAKRSMTPKGEEEASPHTVMEFVRKFDGTTLSETMLEEVNPDFLFQVQVLINRLVADGILFPASSPSFLLFNNTYYCLDYDEEKLKYGGYDFEYLGFPYIRDKFKDSVLPVIVETKNRAPSIGTAFIIGKNKIVTAKHCIDKRDVSKFQIQYKGMAVQINQICYPKLSEESDIAIIHVEESSLPNARPFLFQEPHVLDEILTLGYPPIPGFDAIQFAEVGTINTFLKSSVGNIVGEGESYLDKTPHFLINARVKGGNSGCPIINKSGYVVGILNELSTDSENASRTDIMGYAICQYAEDIIEMLKPSNNLAVDFEEVNDGYYSVK